MADKLLESYNPLYDVHLQQYFAMPHMQKHLRNLGLMEGGDNKGEVYARHRQMIDVMLKNREQQLVKLGDLQKKLDAAEKVEIYRRIRSGQSPETYRRAAKPSRSLSRGRRSVSQSARVRRSSATTEDRDVIAHVEKERDQERMGEAPPRNCYARLSANSGKYKYLHKLDDNTLISYKEQLRRQLDKLERFREVSFGIHSVARTQAPAQQSWFFRRRSIMNIRGRKTAPTQRNLGESYSSRVSCPPAIRKRRSSTDLTTRLPPIARQQAPKTSPAVKNTLPKLPPTTPKRGGGTAAAPAPRGRSSSKGPIRVASTRTTPEADTKLPPIAVMGGAAAGAAAAAAASMVVSPKGSEDDDRSRGYQSASPEPAADVEVASEKTASPAPEKEEEDEEEHHERGKRSVGDEEHEEPEDHKTPEPEQVHEVSYTPEPAHEEEEIHREATPQQEDVEEEEVQVQHVHHDEMVAALGHHEASPEPKSPTPEPREATSEPAVEEKQPTPQPSPEPAKEASPEPEESDENDHKESTPEPIVARDPTPEHKDPSTAEPVVEKDASPEPKEPTPQPSPVPARDASPEPEAVVQIHHEVHTEQEAAEDDEPAHKDASPEPETQRMAPPEIVESLVESEREDDSMATSVYQSNDADDDVDAELESEVLRSPSPEPVGDVIEAAHHVQTSEVAHDEKKTPSPEPVREASPEQAEESAKEASPEPKEPTPQPSPEPAKEASPEPEAVVQIHHEVHAEQEHVDAHKEASPEPSEDSMTHSQIHHEDESHSESHDSMTQSQIHHVEELDSMVQSQIIHQEGDDHSERDASSPVLADDESEHARGKRSAGFEEADGDAVSEHHYEMPEEHQEDNQVMDAINNQLELEVTEQMLAEHHDAQATPEAEVEKEDSPTPASPQPVAESPKAASPVDHHEEAAESPRPLIQARPVHASPEPVAASPEPVAASPEPVAASPEPVHASPLPVQASPVPVAASPEPEHTASPTLASEAGEHHHEEEVVLQTQHELQAEREPSPEHEAKADSPAPQEPIGHHTPEPKEPSPVPAVSASPQPKSPTPEPVVAAASPAASPVQARTPSPKGDAAGVEQHSERDVSSPMSVDSNETDGLKDEEDEEEDGESKKSATELTNNGNSPSSPLDSQPDFHHAVDAAHHAEV